MSSNPLYVIGRGSLVAASSLGLLIAFCRGRPGRRALGATIGVIGFLVTYFDSGTRSWSVLLLVPPLAMAAMEGLRRGHAVRWLVLGVLAAMALVWMSQAQLQFRTSGVDGIGRASAAGRLDNDFFAETALAVSLVPERFPYVHESTWLLFLVNPIPRLLWAEKPYSRVVQVYGLGRRGYDEYVDFGASSLPSIVGQAYMNWGAIGVVLLAVTTGVFMAWLDARWRARRGVGYSRFVYISTAVWLFLSFRILAPGLHYPLLLLVLVGWAARRRARRTNRGPSWAR